jgi:hypothetical protein
MFESSKFIQERKLSANCSIVLASNLVGLAFVQVTKKLGSHPTLQARKLVSASSFNGRGFQVDAVTRLSVRAMGRNQRRSTNGRGRPNDFESNGDR